MKETFRWNFLLHFQFNFWLSFIVIPGKRSQFAISSVNLSTLYIFVLLLLATVHWMKINILCKRTLTTTTTTQKDRSLYSCVHCQNSTNQPTTCLYVTKLILVSQPCVKSHVKWNLLKPGWKKKGQNSLEKNASCVSKLKIKYFISLFVPCRFALRCVALSKNLWKFIPISWSIYSQMLLKLILHN